VLGDRDAAGISEPSSHPETSPPDPELMDTTRPKASAPGRSNEVPVRLIEDDLLSADLCNEVIGSLRHTYRNFKRVVERSRLKSSILAVKADGLQDAHSLKQELAEKDALIAELKEQLAAAQAGGGERDQALRDYAELRQSYADLEEYRKSMEKDLDSADKKLADNMVTIQKLNRDKEKKDKEIDDLEDAARVIIDMVQPPYPGVFERASVLKPIWKMQLTVCCGAAEASTGVVEEGTKEADSQEMNDVTVCCVILFAVFCHVMY